MAAWQRGPSKEQKRLYISQCVPRGPKSWYFPLVACCFSSVVHLDSKSIGIHWPVGPTLQRKRKTQLAGCCCPVSRVDVDGSSMSGLLSDMQWGGFLLAGMLLFLCNDKICAYFFKYLECSLVLVPVIYCRLCPVAQKSCISLYLMPRT